MYTSLSSSINKVDLKVNVNLYVSFLKTAQCNNVMVDSIFPHLQ